MKNTILIITSEFPPLPGGIGNHAYLLSKYLQKSGYQVSVVTDFRSKEEDLVFDEKQEFKVHRIKRNILTQISRIQKAFFLAQENQVVICSGKFSIWLGGFLKVCFPKKKILAVIHGSELKAGGTLSQKLTKWSLKKIDSLIAVSEFTKTQTLKINANLEITVINNGIESGAFSDRKAHIPNEINLVSVGNLTYRKGQQNGIAALPLLKTKFPKIQYHLIGIPTEQKKFAALAKNLGVLDSVTFYGALSDSDLKNRVASSDVFLMLSDNLKNGDVEGFGIAVLEANALGIPAIGSKDSGVADAINDRYSGRLVSAKDSNEILLALEDILNNYTDYSVQAQQWSKQFDWAIVIKKYLEILNK